MINFDDYLSRPGVLGIPSFWGIRFGQVGEGVGQKASLSRARCETQTPDTINLDLRNGRN